MRRLYAGMYQKWNGQRFDALVNAFGLDRDKKIIKFSKGMQKQAAFTLAISAMPDALILDEPVDGLDPIVRRTVWDIIVNDVAEKRNDSPDIITQSQGDRGHLRYGGNTLGRRTGA